MQNQKVTQKQNQIKSNDTEQTQYKNEAVIEQKNNQKGCQLIKEINENQYIQSRNCESIKQLFNFSSDKNYLYPIKESKDSYSIQSNDTKNQIGYNFLEHIKNKSKENDSQKQDGCFLNNKSLTSNRIKNTFKYISPKQNICDQLNFDRKEICSQKLKSWKKDKQDSEIFYEYNNPLMLQKINLQPEQSTRCVSTFLENKALIKLKNLQEQSEVKITPFTINKTDKNFLKSSITVFHCNDKLNFSDLDEATLINYSQQNSNKIYSNMANSQNIQQLVQQYNHKVLQALKLQNLYNANQKNNEQQKENYYPSQNNYTMNQFSKNKSKKVSYKTGKYYNHPNNYTVQQIKQNYSFILPILLRRNSNIIQPSFKQIKQGQRNKNQNQPQNMNKQEKIQCSLYEDSNYKVIINKFRRFKNRKRLRTFNQLKFKKMINTVSNQKGLQKNQVKKLPKRSSSLQDGNLNIYPQKKNIFHMLKKQQRGIHKRSRTSNHDIVNIKRNIEQTNSQNNYYKSRQSTNPTSKEKINLMKKDKIFEQNPRPYRQSQRKYFGIAQEGKAQICYNIDDLINEKIWVRKNRYLNNEN